MICWISEISSNFSFIVVSMHCRRWFGGHPREWSRSSGGDWRWSGPHFTYPPPEEEGGPHSGGHCGRSEAKKRGKKRGEGWATLPLLSIFCYVWASLRTQPPNLLHHVKAERYILVIKSLYLCYLQVCILWDFINIKWYIITLQYCVSYDV